MLAYLVVGIVLGIWFEPGEEAKLFFEVGVLFLFFLIGIDEIDISGFVETLRGRFFVAALVSFAVPFAANLAVFLYVIDLSAANAITLASLMGLSSLGIAARVLGDLGRLKEPVGLEIFTTVVMVEIVGLLVAGFALEESSHPGELGGWKIAILLGEIILFVAASWVLSAKVVPRVLVSLQTDHRSAPARVCVDGGQPVHRGLGRPRDRDGRGPRRPGLRHGQLRPPRRLRNDILPSIRGLSQGVFVPSILRFRRDSGRPVLHQSARLDPRHRYPRSDSCQGRNRFIDGSHRGPTVSTPRGRLRASWARE